MPIADDWDFDYANTIVQHVDGVLSYDGGSGTQPAVGQYVYGVTSGAIGKVIARTGTVTSGTLTLTNVEGLFEDNEQLDIASELNFDNVTAGNGGFAVGDIIENSGQTKEITTLAIEYNADGLGTGTIYGNNVTGIFSDNEQLDIQGGQADVADAVGVSTNNDAALTAAVAGTLAVPGTANTNDSIIIDYDGGTVTIPEQAIVRDASTGAFGLVEQVYGVQATGSVRIVDSNTTGGAWTNNNNLELDQVIGYNNQVAGQVFSVGDVVVGATSGATGRVLQDTGTQLILADESGTWTTTEDLEVNGVKIADADGTNTTLVAAVINTPSGVRTEQRSNAVGGGSAQGGIYDAADSLNIVRKLNSLYTLSQDTFDELDQLDDDEAFDAAVRNGAYQLVFGWFTYDLSTRFLRSGGLTDTTGANVWANPQTVGAQNKITATAFAYSSAQPYRQPQIYIEQDQRKIAPWWLEGNIDVLIKVRTRTDTRYIAPATPTLGQLIPGGDPATDGSYTVLNREYHVSTYDATQADAAGGGVNTVALGTQDETVNNPNGTHSMVYTGGSAAALIVGEEFTAGAGNSLKVGIVVSDTGGTAATGTLEYVLKSGTNFVNTDACTGTISGKTFTSPTPTSVVAGYGADIGYQVVDIAATPTDGTGITGTFIPGEPVTQAVTGATGIVVGVDDEGANPILNIQVTTGTFSGANDITGDTSSASWDAGTAPTYPSVESWDADLNNGEGYQPYAGSVSGDITGANARTIQDVFQYGKYLTRQEEETFTFNGPGTADAGTVGRFFRKLKDAYAEVKPGAPIGTFTGSLAFAQGWFLDTGYIDANDIRSFSVIDDNGNTRQPPNLQALTITNLQSLGFRVAAYRSTGVGLTTILRNEFDVGAVGSGNNQAGDNTILVGANTRTVSPLPADVPDVGVLRVLDPNDTGNYLRFPYSSVDRTNNIFTLASGTIGAVTGGQDLVLDDNVHVVFIEEVTAGASVSNTIQYVADIPIVYKARLKGYEPFRATTTFGSGGASAGIVVSDDTIVDLP